MEGLGAAANIIAVVDLSAKVASLCLQYSKEVAGARDEINRLHSHVKQLGGVLEAARRLAESPKADALDTSTSRELVDAFGACKIELKNLEARLEPSSSASNARRVMRRFGIRALKWPFTSKEVNQTINNLDRFGRVISLGLQIDQTNLIVDIHENVKNLTLQQAEDRSTEQNVHLVLPFPRDSAFVQRPSVWTSITALYDNPAHQRLALVGMGGFGKSQLAIHFAHHVHENSPETSIFWVYGRTRVTFEDSYRTIARTAQLPGCQDSSFEALTVVRDWLQGHNTSSAKPWLLIVDNADDIDTFFPKDVSDDSPRALYLPTVGGKILITSRSLDVAERLTGASSVVVRIPVMDEEQALRLLRNKLAGEVDDGAAKDLIATLDRIPLALNQAAAYINRRSPQMTVQSYVSDFRSNEKRKDSLLRIDKGDLRRHADVSNSVVVTSQITFEQVRRERPRAADLLSLMSCFQPQNIPESILLSAYGKALGPDDEDAYDEGDAAQNFEDDMDVLLGYSLVAATGTPGLCEMHSLVQFCARVWVAEHDDPERWKRHFLNLAAQDFPTNWTSSLWEQSQRLFPHVEPILTDKVTEEADQLSRAQLLTSVSSHLKELGALGRAMELAKEAVDVRMAFLGEEHESTLRSLMLLAVFCLKNGLYSEAEQLASRNVELLTLKYGPGDPKTLHEMKLLGRLHNKQGRYEEALTILTEILDVSIASFGRADANTLDAMNEVAWILLEQSQYTEVLDLYENTLETCKTILGADSRDVLIAEENKAEALRKLGRWEEAEPLQIRVVEAFADMLGAESDYALTAMNNLAVAYLERDLWEKARPLLVRVLITRRSQLGEDHPETAGCKHNLAISYFAEKRFDMAGELFAQALSVRRANIGESNSEDVRMSMKGVARSWYGLGRHGDAVALMDECAELWRQTSFPDHPKAKLVYRILEDWREAEVKRSGAASD